MIPTPRPGPFSDPRYLRCLAAAALGGLIGAGLVRLAVASGIGIDRPAAMIVCFIGGLVAGGLAAKAQGWRFWDGE